APRPPLPLPARLSRVSPPAPHRAGAVGPGRAPRPPLPADVEDGRGGPRDAGGLSRRGARRAGGHRRRRLHARHPPREAREGLRRDQLRPAGAVHRALRGHRGGGGLGSRRRSPHSRAARQPGPSGRAHCGDGSTVERGVQVPAVLVLKPVMATLGDPRRAWLLVAMASTLAGNLTLIGSVANLIVVEAAREARIEIGFWSTRGWACRSPS